jgi:hypothetical protein
MLRILTLFVSLGLGLTALSGIAAAQDTITSDGGYVRADDTTGDETVDGGGTNIVYGDVSTGNTGGEVLGDPSAIYYPDLSNVPSPTGRPWTPTITGIPVGHPGAGDMIPGFDISFDISMAPPAEEPPASDDAVGESTGESTGEEIVVEDPAEMTE